MGNFRDLDSKRKRYLASTFLSAELLTDQLAGMTNSERNSIVALCRIKVKCHLERYSDRDLEKLIDSFEEKLDDENSKS